MTVFFRLLGEQTKDDALKTMVKFGGYSVFDVNPESFKKIPGAPFAYWVDDAVRDVFQKHEPFLTDDRRPSFGASTKDDERFLRCIWEIPHLSVARNRGDTQTRKWVEFAK